MLIEEVIEILAESEKNGWVMEPDAKRIFSMMGIEVPRFKYTSALEEAIAFASETGFPVVGKVVSSEIIHKSESGGVVLGIKDKEDLMRVFKRFSVFDGFSGILVEETLSGIELIVGAKMDYQFGPIILLGIGGTGVEIYRDTAIRMAPLDKRDVYSMVDSLKAHKILEGYRGSDSVNKESLSRMIIKFSELIMLIQDKIESVDLNPVICSSDRCVVADARIILRNGR